MLTCVVLALTMGAARQAAAQRFLDWTAQVRAKPAYADFRTTLHYYGGDRTTELSSPLVDTDRVGGGLGLEAGLEWTPRYSVGVFMLRGMYPKISTGRNLVPGNAFVRADDSSDWLTFLGLVGRARLRPGARISPYALAGLTLGMSHLNEKTRYGYGPRLGLGADYAWRGYTFFGELDALFITDDDLDLAQATSSGDVFPALTLGVRYRRRGTPAGPRLPRIQRVEAPAELATGACGVFLAYTSLDDAAAPGSFLWDFGDGAQASDRIVAHSYARPGTYTVTFTTLSDAGPVTETRTVTVTAASVPATEPEPQPEPEQPPRPAPRTSAPRIDMVRTSPIWPDQGEAVRFEASLTAVPPFTCRWAFGDGATAETCDAVHAYARPGAYTATLSVRNAGGVDTFERLVEVQENPCAGRELNLVPVYFEAGEPTLSVDARAFLRDNINQLVLCPGLPLTVTGYAAPDEADAAALAQARAQAVAEYYVTLGIAADRLHVQEAAVGSAGGLLWQQRRVETAAGKKTDR